MSAQSFPRKAARTIKEERLVLEKWKAHLGNTRIDQLTLAQTAAYRNTRLVEGLAPRSINLPLTMLRNVLAKAVEDGLIPEMPRIKGFKASEARAPARPRLTDQEFEKLSRAALDSGGKNGQLLHDLLRFLGYSGARKTESLKMLWRDVELDGGLIRFRNPKGGIARAMELNPSLRAHLEDMKSRRDPESSYLFPSPERGSRDEHARNLAEAFKLARKACGLDRFALVESQTDKRLAKRTALGFHDIRRYFVTRALELGIDPQTISRWVGHKDGDALVLRTYASVRADHRASMAAKLDLSVALAYYPCGRERKWQVNKCRKRKSRRFPMIARLLAYSPPSMPSATLWTSRWNPET